MAKATQLALPIPGPGSLSPIFFKIHGTKQGHPFAHILAGIGGLISLLWGYCKDSSKIPWTACHNILKFCIHITPSWSVIGVQRVVYTSKIYINLVLILLYGFIFFAFVQSNKLGVVCMLITGQQIAKFPCNAPWNWWLVNRLGNALHLVSERGSPIILFSILQAL